MPARQLSVPDAYEFSPSVFPDERGLFVAPLIGADLAGVVGYELQVAQSNLSVSRRGAVRGIHVRDVPPGQAKYVHCVRGALLDVAVDLRVGSPTFGRWDSVRLDGVGSTAGYRAVFLAEGIGHAFFALEDDTVVSYLCSTGYAPGEERTVNPLDPALGLPWPPGVEPLLSPKDRDAPTLEEAAAAGILPTWDACQEHYRALRNRPGTTAST